MKALSRKQNFNFIPVVGFLSIYMFYFPLTTVNAIDVSIGMVLLCVLGFIGIIKSNYNYLFKSISLLFIFFIISLLIPFFYSSNLKMGVLYIYKGVLSLFCIFAGFYISEYDKSITYLKSISLVALPIAVANILFAIFPTLESVFYNSEIAKFIIAPSNIAEMTTNNVTDLQRSGVPFINVNNASVFYILLLCLAFYLYKMTKLKRYILFCILYLVAQLCTGCRTGLGVLFLCGLWQLLVGEKKKNIGKFVFLLIMLVGGGFVLSFLHFGFIDKLLSRLSIDKILADPRFNKIWPFAFKNLKASGFGYGGWEELSSQVIFNDSRIMPAHNHLLVLAYIGGLLPCMFYILFWGMLVIKSYIGWNKNHNYCSLLLGVISINIVAHGMFDNYFLNHMNLISLAFSLIGYCCAKIEAEVDLLSTLYRLVTPWAISTKKQILKNKIVSKISSLIYMVYCFHPSFNIATQHKKNVIVSVTSFPNRLYKGSYYCLVSLLRQNIKPAKTILWLATEQFPEGKGSLPKRILNLEKYGLDIRFCQDFKSYKKIIKTAQLYGNKNIVTADDDTLYPEYWLAELLNCANNNPNTVICYRAHKIKISNGEICSYAQWEKLAKSEIGPSMLLMPVGVGGVLYPPNYFRDIRMDWLEIKEIAPTTDDIWLKIIGVKKGIKVRKVCQFSKEWFTVLGSQKIRLMKENVELDNKNDAAIIKTMKYYNIDVQDLIDL